MAMIGTRPSRLCFSGHQGQGDAVHDQLTDRMGVLGLNAFQNLGPALAHVAKCPIISPARTKRLA